MLYSRFSSVIHFLHTEWGQSFHLGRQRTQEMDNGELYSNVRVFRATEQYVQSNTVETVFYIMLLLPQ